MVPITPSSQEAPSTCRTWNNARDHTGPCYCPQHTRVHSTIALDFESLFGFVLMYSPDWLELFPQIMHL